MKKILLTSLAFAALSLTSLNAKTVEVASWYTGNDATFGGWGGSATFEQVTEDDKPCIKITNPSVAENDWNVQIGIDVDLENGKTYALSFDVKGTPATGITAGIQNSTDYSGKGNFTTFDVTETWKSVAITATVTGDNANRITINVGKYVGTFYMTNVKLTYDDGETPDTPDTPEGKEVASWYTGNDATFGGWGGSATFEQVTEDDKPCIKVTNPSAAENDWNVQIGIDVNLENGKTYALSFDVKGTPATGITAGIQNSTDYSGKGNFTNFDITEAWKPVTIKATVTGDNANRITINVGKYVGTFYMTNVVLSEIESASLDAVEVTPVVDHWTVYNLSGVKVLDTDNKSDLDMLGTGIYIVNGKKVAIRR